MNLEESALQSRICWFVNFVGSSFEGLSLVVLMFLFVMNAGCCMMVTSF